LQQRFTGIDVRKPAIPTPGKRATFLDTRRNAKMAQSAHAYVRGNTVKFYDWLNDKNGKLLPEGPPVWICGDCHLGNLGPVANVEGGVDIQIRDLDQTVIGNPAHDLVRLGLSLAMAARGSDLPGVTIANMIEDMVVGYREALIRKVDNKVLAQRLGKAVTRIMHQALRRKWKNLAEERIGDVRPSIPRGGRFWSLTGKEQNALERFIATEPVRKLVTSLHHRDDNAKIKLLDAAYWVKGCSSLGRLRYAVLVSVGKHRTENDGGICFLDIKEATAAAAPRFAKGAMPRGNAERVVTGARSLSPNLGDRMLAARLGGKSVVVRELLPQDLKLEIDQLTRAEAVTVARFLAGVVGRAHARQLDKAARRKWHAELAQQHSKTLDAPSWLWTSVTNLVADHELGYLEHCRTHSAIL
jgi:uncharacterized protein (DUF2252 family)